MPVSIYELAVPPMLKGFEVLRRYLQKADEYARTSDIDIEELLDARLAPDMLTLTGQIQRASDKSKNGIARILGIQAPAFSDDEVTVDDLKHRIAKTVAFLESVRADDLNSNEGRPVEIKFRSITGTFPASTYLTNILLPDFYFHVATAHGILRNRGVQIGKADYLGKIGA